MTDPATTLPVEHLCTVHLDVGTPTYVKDGPEGTKLMVAITGGTVRGARLNGTVQPYSGGDWVSIGNGGNMRIDVRLTIETDDGAAIFVSYRGVLDGGRAVCGPLFETGDERYAWLNKHQGVGIGSASAEGVDYEFYAVL